MLAIHPTPAHAESARIVTVLAAAALVRFWRAALRLALLAIASGAIALAGLGAYTLIQSARP